MNKTDDSNPHETLLKQIENISTQIQLLALNIAVSAAKVAQRRSLGLEVNDRLSQLVNQATNTVKTMNELLDTAKSDVIAESSQDIHLETAVHNSHFDELERSVSAIIRDSEKVVNLLNDIKKNENPI